MSMSSREIEQEHKPENAGGQNNDRDVEPEEGPSNAELLERIEELEAEHASTDDFARVYLKKQLASKDEEIAELRQQVQRLEKLVDGLQQRHEQFMGVSDGGKGAGPEKRALDLREALIREAKNISADGRAKMHHKDVEKALVQMGYDEVHKPDRYDAMRRLHDLEGFFETTKTKNGQKVEAVAVDIDAVPGEATGHEGSRKITTGSEGGDASAVLDSTEETT